MNGWMNEWLHECFQLFLAVFEILNNQVYLNTIVFLPLIWKFIKKFAIDTNFLCCESEATM